MIHHCEAILIHCMDFRLREDIFRLMSDMGLLKMCDDVSIAGGAGALLNKDARDLVINQIETAIRLHHIKKIILMNHTDCGAYGGQEAFASKAEEYRKHKDDLQKAERMVKEKFPNLEIIKFIANVTMDQAVKFEKII